MLKRVKYRAGVETKATLSCSGNIIIMGIKLYQISSDIITVQLDVNQANNAEIKYVLVMDYSF